MMLLIAAAVLFQANGLKTVVNGSFKADAFAMQPATQPELPDCSFTFTRTWRAQCSDVALEDCPHAYTSWGLHYFQECKVSDGGDACLPTGPRCMRTEDVPNAWLKLEAANEGYGCGVSATGRARCMFNKREDTRVPADLKLVSAVPERGNDFGCGLDVDGKVHCWGDERAYGNNGGRCRWVSGWHKMLLQPPSNLPAFKELRMGMRVGCGIEKSGSAITCWGVLISNEEGKTWRQETGAITQLTVGDRWICVLTSAKGVKCWDMLRSRPTSTIKEAKVPELPPILQVKASERQICARDEDGKVHCFGEMSYEVPTHRFKFLEASIWWFCGVTTDGILYQWRDRRNSADLETPLDVKVETCSSGSYGGLALDAAGVAHGYGNMKSFWATPPEDK